MDPFVKNYILELAKENGYDVDGDIITINQKTYFVHIGKNYVRDITNEKEIYVC